MCLFYLTFFKSSTEQCFVSHFVSNLFYLLDFLVFMVAQYVFEIFKSLYFI